MNERGRCRVLLAATILAVATVGVTAAQPTEQVSARAVVGEPAGQPLTDEPLARRTEEVAGLMRCPVCQGLSVADSPTPQALALKGKVETLLASGFTEEQVLTYFEASYGEFIRLSPKPEGFNLVVWWLPVVMLIVGGVLVGYRVRSRTADEVSLDADALADLRARVRREVGDPPGGSE